MDSNDFASLLEREPLNDGLIHTTHEVQFMNDAGAYSPGTITVGSRQKTALDSASERIEELEGVLVAIRARAAKALGKRAGGDFYLSAEEAMSAIISLINETLDPCKPWCVLEENHGGACCPQEDERE